MTTNFGKEAALHHFQAGKHCLLLLAGQRFQVTLLEVLPQTLRLTCPPEDLYLDEAPVELEFADPSGYCRYKSRVAEVPKTPGDGLVLERPAEPVEARKRGTWRIPADFRVALKEHVHPRRRTVPVINISAGGMLIRLDTQLAVDDNVDLTFTPPGGEEEQLIGKVVQVVADYSDRVVSYQVSLQFIGIDPVSARNIGGYVWRRLQVLYPDSAPSAEPDGD